MMFSAVNSVPMIVPLALPAEPLLLDHKLRTRERMGPPGRKRCCVLFRQVDASAEHDRRALKLDRGPSCRCKAILEIAPRRIPSPLKPEVNDRKDS